ELSAPQPRKYSSPQSEPHALPPAAAAPCIPDKAHTRDISKASREYAACISSAPAAQKIHARPESCPHPPAQTSAHPATNQTTAHLSEPRAASPPSSVPQTIRDTSACSTDQSLLHPA